MLNIHSLYSKKTSRPLLFLFSSLLLCGCFSGKSVAQRNSGAIRVLIVGGGSSHDFNRWYKEADSITLSKDGFASVTYTSGVDSILPLLPQTDVLYLTNNQPMTDPGLRKAIFGFAAAGKGLVLTHAATWYNWKDWPEYNATLVGGGSRGHERYGDFDVSIVNPNHPITKNVEKTFHIKDELYRMTTDSAGAGIDVLAIATVPGTQTTYPLLWITKNAKARIVGFTLGHDAEAHDLPAYQALLKNAIKWAARK